MYHQDVFVPCHNTVLTLVLPTSASCTAMIWNAAAEQAKLISLAG